MRSIELVFTGNGPGELAGWVRPVARAARELARKQEVDLRLTMALTPSQFASGREPHVLRGWGLFDRILEPSRSVKLAVGIGSAGTDGQGALLHLGGDLWFSAKLASRWRIPACAVAETTLIARRHRQFSLVFATSDQIAERLSAFGVPREKVVVCGDPRVDAVETSEEGIDHRPTTSDLRFVVSFMPSSRDYLFKALVPYFIKLATQVREREPAAEYQMVCSPFLSPGVVAGEREATDRSWPALPIHWVVGEAWPALAKSDFVVTIPGTNTVELAAGGVPFAVLAPAEMLDHLRLEGIANWVARLPLVGRGLKRAVALKMMSSQRFLAIPNQRAGRVIAPEWVGTWPEDELANHVAELLDNKPRRDEIAQELRELYAEGRGASRRIAEHSMALAGGRMG